VGKKLVVGVDLGGTKIYTAAANLKGSILSEDKRPTGASRGPKAVIKEIVSSIEDVVFQTGSGIKSIKAIGVGAPGPVNFLTGTVMDPPNLPGWHSVPLKKILGKRLGIRIEVDNDANLAGLAEVRFGAAKGLSEVVYITASTGVGGGLICNGKLYRGADGAAGEVGHMTIIPNGPLCNCGNRGCLEAVASGTAFQRLHGYSTEEAVQRIKNGDHLALVHVEELACNLGIGLANITNIFNPQAIVLGGGMSNMGPLLFKPLRTAIKKYGFSIAGRRVRLIKSSLGKRVGVMGAIALALESD